ncbi:MAG TPA: hypothetical protein DD725_05610 [Deltaproteobacteria bacterium]|nr:hypothetical protein [Deltaproteobacteria bacterium]
MDKSNDLSKALDALAKMPSTIILPLMQMSEGDVQNADVFGLIQQAAETIVNEGQRIIDALKLLDGTGSSTSDPQSDILRKPISGLTDNSL